MKETMYLYPITGRRNETVTNPYMYRLADVLSKDFEILNLEAPSTTGIIDLLKYLRRVKIIYLNWIEDLPEKHMGVIQTIFFIPLAILLKIFGKRLIWTLHNKRSHSKKYPHLKQLLFNFMRRQSDLVVTHASEGLDCIPNNKRKAYFPHPVYNSTLKTGTEKQYDLIIWGSITRYKGVDSFIQFMEKEDRLNQMDILIAGKISHSDIENYLIKMSKEYTRLTVINRFIENEELDAFIARSKIILFTYHAKSILSSGALMDSLNYKSWIIGPRVGGFLDLQKEGIIQTYNTFEDLPALIDMLLRKELENDSSLEKRISFMEKHSWDAYGAWLNNEIKALI